MPGPSAVTVAASTAPAVRPSALPARHRRRAAPGSAARSALAVPHSERPVPRTATAARITCASTARAVAGQERLAGRRPTAVPEPAPTAPARAVRREAPVPAIRIAVSAGAAAMAASAFRPWAGRAPIARNARPVRPGSSAQRRASPVQGPAANRAAHSATGPVSVAPERASSTGLANKTPPERAPKKLRASLRNWRAPDGRGANLVARFAQRCARRCAKCASLAWR